MKQMPTWITEKAAADMLGVKERTLRKQVKGLQIKVNYRSTNGRNFQYCKQDLEKFMLETSTITA